MSPSRMRPTRRELLRLGAPALLGARSIVRAGSPRPAGAPGFGRARSVLVVFTSGGQSQLDTWDPKPDAPGEVRGAFGSVATTVPGLRVCEHLPRLAGLAHRYAVVRAMTHDDLDHGSACYLALTGQFHPRKSSNPPPRGTDAPTLGALVHRVRPDRTLPHSAFHVNGPLLAPREPSPGQFGGVLGRGYDPPDLGDVTHGTQLAHGLTPRPDLPADRLAGRRGLVANLEAAAQVPLRLPGTAGQVSLTRQAYELVDTPRVRDAFAIDREPARVRDRYGRHRAGQACLMGRRLVEAGVPWVTVFFNHNIRGQDFHAGDTDHYGWDTHNDIFGDMRDHLLPRFDASVSTLLEDLAGRGLLDTTLVCVMGEFGRAPLVAVEKNFEGRGAPGRKHWAACYSVVLAGAGVTPGAVYGSSDRHAAYPKADPVTPGDLTATLFHALGVDPGGHYTDLTDRPSRLTTGDPVTRLFR